MKTITMIGTLPPVKGISPYTQELCTELAKHVKIDFIGFKQIYPEFLYPGGTRVPGAKAPRIKNLKNRSFLTWYNPFTWIWAGLTCKGDVVHAQWWAWPLAPVYGIILLIAKVRGKHIIITVHNLSPHESNFISRLLNKSIFVLADQFIAHSAHRGRSQKKLLLGKPLTVIPHGPIKLEVISQNKRQLREAHSIASDAKVVLFFGTIRDYKGLNILIEATAKIPRNDIQLVIMGKPWGDFKKYEDLIVACKMKERTKLYLEFVSNKVLSEFVKLADVIVFPYLHFEASSGAAAAATASGATIVATSVGAFSETIPPKYLARPGSVSSLVRSIEYAIAHPIVNPSIPTWEQTISRTLEVYDAS